MILLQTVFLMGEEMPKSNILPDIYTTPRFSISCKAIVEKLVERGALAFSGARNANLKIY